MNAYVYRADLYCEACTAKIKAKGGTTGEGRLCYDPKHETPCRYDWCPACLDECPEPDESTYDSDDWPKGPYPEGGGEADTPNHCASCQLFLENPLTDDGYRYVLNELAGWLDGQRRAGDGSSMSEAEREWFNFYLGGNLVNLVREAVRVRWV